VSHPYSPEAQALIAAIQAGDCCDECSAPNDQDHFDACSKHPENVKAVGVAVKGGKAVGVAVRSTLCVCDCGGCRNGRCDACERSSFHAYMRGRENCSTCDGGGCGDCE